MGIGIDQWEWEGIEILIVFPLTSTRHARGDQTKFQFYLTKMYRIDSVNKFNRIVLNRISGRYSCRHLFATLRTWNNNHSFTI